MNNRKQNFNNRIRRNNNGIRRNNFIAGMIAITVFLIAIVCVVVYASSDTDISPGLNTSAEISAGAGNLFTVNASVSPTPDNTPDAEITPENLLVERIKESETLYGYECPVTDWSGYDFTEFTEYNIPADFVRYGGAFPLCLQAYTYIKCREYGVDYALILAMIETESSYKPGAVSYDGKCKGFIQINPGFHADRMERIGAEDLFNPYDNIAVGVDFISELLHKYDENILKALAAYNMGATGAYRNLWSKGIFEYSYTDKVTQRAERINNEIKRGNAQ